MQFKLLSALALATLAVAAPGGTPTPPPPSCSTGTVECCNSVQAANNPVVGILASLLGIESYLGPPLASTAQTACCTGNNFSGAIVVGCSPININL
ncbi:hydrophobin-319 [Coprinopsis sp. MPI-PUGE-AT-0042]|nr:hydrophobin-319 [Coprinopsis sp. MPI-PUGE-AT-0042]